MKTCDSYRLYTPGPTSIPNRVLLAQAKPMMHHRTPEFSAIITDLTEKLQYLFDTKAEPLLVHTTGRGSMEGVITNLLNAGDEIIAIANGKFGRMFAKIAESYGVTAHQIETDDDLDISLERVEAAMTAHPNARAVTVCHGDTSTGRKADVPAIVRLSHQHGMMCFVDCISTAGCERISFDEWGVDALITCTQKGLMAPTGMSIVFLSELAWSAAETATLPKFYVNFKSIREFLVKKHETPGSTPVSIVYALQESLTMLQEEGREQVFARHDAMAKAVRAGLETMGMRLYPTPENCATRSNAMTAFQPPEGVEAAAVRNLLRDRYGMLVAGGLDKQSGKILRLAHMGAFYASDALAVVSALEAVLYELTGRVPGTGLAACIKALNE